MHYQLIILACFFLTLGFLEGAKTTSKSKAKSTRSTRKVMRSTTRPKTSPMPTVNKEDSVEAMINKMQAMLNYVPAPDPQDLPPNLVNPVHSSTSDTKTAGKGSSTETKKNAKSAKDANTPPKQNEAPAANAKKAKAMLEGVVASVETGGISVESVAGIIGGTCALVGIAVVIVGTVMMRRRKPKSSIDTAALEYRRSYGGLTYTDK